MKIITVQFDYGNGNQYARMLEVFRKSCAECMPNVKFEAIQLPAPSTYHPGYTTGMGSNVYKMRVWQQVMEKATETVAFCDCDMIALRSIEDAEQVDFDLAYTVRKSATIPINGGVLFVRPTAAGKAAMAKLNEIDDLMFTDVDLHHKWRAKYAGMNQAAFGYLLENHSDIAKMVALPCAVYNSCCDTWPTIDKEARLVHIKGNLRRGLVANMPESQFESYLRFTVRTWKRLDGGAQPTNEFVQMKPERREIGVQNATLPEAVGVPAEGSRSVSFNQFRRRYRG